MQGHHKYSDGFSDTSSVGSFMDETDREVSNLTDRAFRSLCIGEEAIYNDSEISSPTERHKAFTEEVQQKEVLKKCQETFSYGIQYGEPKRKSEVTSTFQHSYVDVAQEQLLRDECMSYMSNGSMEATWQQRRSTSRVSSLIKAFSSREGDSGIPNVVLQRDKYEDFNNGSWDKTALLSIQRELSEFSSTCHQNFKSGPFQSYRNHFHASAAAVARMDASLVKTSKSKFHALNSTNFFFHSEFSPFQLWEDYNRFPFEREQPLGFVSASEFPRWYDSPLYKELTETQTFSSESRRFNRRKIEDVVPTQRSRSTVIQKASAIEKRCESEMASNCPPWKRNNNFVRSKLPGNRPSTVSPTNEKINRPDSSLLSYNRHTYDIQHKIEKVGGSELSSSSTPFSITQLLTPVIHGRQETETSEILQFAHTPSLPDYSVQGDLDQKPLSDGKQLRDSYKSKASSLLFNLKDNRKRVKSTYSPSKFKGLEITDRNKQPSKLEDLESRLSDTCQEHSAVLSTWELGDTTQQTYDGHLSQTFEHKEYADGLHDMTLAHQYCTGNYEMSYGYSQGSSLHPYKPLNKESEEYEYGFSPHMLLAQNKGMENFKGHLSGPSGTCNPPRPEIDNILSKVHPPAHSISAQMSEKQTFSRREDIGHHDPKESQNFQRKSSLGYIKNQVTEERPSWENSGPVNITNREMAVNNGIKDPLPFKGEIATLIEMDKHRKATAKQYLPSANNSYTSGKETYINKVNDNIKQSRLAEEEEVQDTEYSSRKYPSTSKPAQYNPTNTPSTSQNWYGFHNNGLYKITSSPPKETKLTRNSEFRSTMHNEVCFQRDVKYAKSDINTKKDSGQKIPCYTSSEENRQKHEGSVAYQPYKYEPNKQWHIATTENTSTIDEVRIPRQLPTEKESEQPREPHNPHSLLGLSDALQKNLVYTRTTLEDRLGIGKHKPNESMVPNQIYQAKHDNMKTDIKKQNNQSTEPNNNVSQAREDRFSINDILSIRDNEQAKRTRENKNSLIATDPTKLQSEFSVVPSVTAEEKAAKTDMFTVKENHTTNDPISRYKHDSTYGFTRKEPHNRNEGLLNIDTAMKDKSAKEIFTAKDNDKITTRTLSYRERGQTKQEILTSKLKAHAQKEISAIKEKGLAKQAILSRNPVKPNTAVTNDKGQMSQELVPPKKEITAEKLNHLFQDITYSSVTFYKEHRNQDKDGPKYESLTAEEIKLPTRDVGPQAEVAVPEKNNEAVKENILTTNEKEGTKGQPPTQRIQAHDKNITKADKNICEFSQASTENWKEQSFSKTVTQKTIPAKSLSSSPAIKSPSKEASFIKTEEQTCNLLTAHREHPAFVENVAGSPKNIFGKTTTCSLTQYKDSELTKLPDLSVTKTEQPSRVKVDKLTASRITAHYKDTDLAETAILQEENLHPSAKEMPVKELNEKKTGSSLRQANTHSDWTKLKVEASPVKSMVESTDAKDNLPTKPKPYSTKEKEQGKSGDDDNKVSVAEQKALSVIGIKENGLKRFDIQKGKEEPASSRKEIVKDEAVKVNKDAKKAFFLVKVEKDTEGETIKDDMNLKEGIAQLQGKADEVSTDRVRKDDWHTKSKASVAFKDSCDSVPKETASSGEVLSGKHDDRTNVYQYYPGKGFLPETKGKVYDTQSSTHHDTVLKKKESISRKSEVTMRDNRTTRPEISALADYARLRVISAEDDSTTEKDLLQKIDTHHKYNLSAAATRKVSQGNVPMSIGDTEPKREFTVNKNCESQSTKPFRAHEKDRPLFQRRKITEEIHEGHVPRDETVTHAKLPSLAKRSDDKVFAVNHTESTKEKILTNQIQSETKTSLTEHHYRNRGNRQSPNLQVQGKNSDPPVLRQPFHDKLSGKDVYPHVKNQEPHMSIGSVLNKVNKQIDNQNLEQPEMNVGEKVEELEYYTVSSMEREPKAKEKQETLPCSEKIAPKKEETEIPTTRQRSSSSSPAMGKPTMFRVKDNTIRTSSVSKSVKPRFHRSFSEEFRIESAKEILSNSEKFEIEPDVKESVNPPVLHEPAVASHRLPKAREVQSLSSEFIATNEQHRSYQRRSQMFEDDETRSVISTMSEDVESFAGSSVGMTDNTASHVFEMKSNRGTYVRPESACYSRPESSCYERPESACYDRPESACSDMRSMGKPPTVPPKSEKALRRAKKLTTRRIKKAEAKISSDSQGQLETKSIRTVSSLPTSPMELLTTHHAVQASPPISHYHVEPNYAPPTPSLVAHPFPVTQRKLLQDPNSGQYFMVDMPVPVKTKMFFDPETGKYVQLNVRQRTQSTLPQPQSVEVLNHSFVVYPGFLPIACEERGSRHSL
ncbi:hypothetical protein NFI96_004957 [Prochilodus magdalenae]|nr:hypothetical protein NFI96_004957 [Prochilodus magdalenae]